MNTEHNLATSLDSLIDVIDTNAVDAIERVILLCKEYEYITFDGKVRNDAVFMNFYLDRPNQQKHRDAVQWIGYSMWAQLPILDKDGITIDPSKVYHGSQVRLLTDRLRMLLL